MKYIARTKRKILIKSKYLSEKYNCQIYLKPEWYGETGSHKDKWAKEAIKIAIKNNKRKVVCMSSGNQGLALAAQAFKYSIECVILSLNSIPKPYIRLFKKYHADLILAKDELHITLTFKKYIQNGYFPLSITHNQRKTKDLPGIEGYQASADDIVTSLGSSPDIIVFPTAYADHSEGVLRGFLKLYKNKKIKKIPQFILVRARLPEGSVARSITTNANTPYVKHVIRKTKGKKIFLTNKDFINAKLLAKKRFGFNLEDSSAGAIACLSKLNKKNLTQKSVVLVLTALEK